VKPPVPAFARHRPISELFAAARQRIYAAVDDAPEPDVLAADPDEWGERLAASERLDTPTVHVDDVGYTDEGEVMVDCTDWAGVTYSVAEDRPHMRPGRRIRLRIPISGPTELLQYQLYGYSTWRDSRLALIFFVANRNFTTVVSKAREVMEDRPEFQAWIPPTDAPGEMRCRICWPDDPERQATLAVQLFHIPETT
jgi:hypothetical protein